MNNKFGVPYHTYQLLLGKSYGDFNDKEYGVEKDNNGNRVVSIDVGCEEDWGNIQECFDDDVKEIVAWGNAEDYCEIVEVFDNETSEYIIGKENIIKWAENNVWCYVDNYSS